MIYPRLIAALYVCTLIACLALAAIGAVAVGGPLLAHGNDLDHKAGKIVSVNTANTTFVLVTANQQHMVFQCGSQRCRVQLAHLQRHAFIHANTDVYYMPVMGNKLLLAMDVD